MSDSGPQAQLEPSSAAVAFARFATQDGASREILTIPSWGAAQWSALFAHTQPLDLAAGAVLIQPRLVDRALFFVADGRLEVASISKSGESLGILNRISAGSVVGELTFFDGHPRSAKVWAVTPSRLLKLTFEDYQRFCAAHPADVPAFLFGMGRLLSERLRNATARL